MERERSASGHGLGNRAVSLNIDSCIIIATRNWGTKYTYTPQIQKGTTCQDEERWVDHFVGPEICRRCQMGTSLFIRSSPITTIGTVLRTTSHLPVWFPGVYTHPDRIRDVTDWLRLTSMAAGFPGFSEAWDGPGAGWNHISDLIPPGRLDSNSLSTNQDAAKDIDTYYVYADYE